MSGTWKAKICMSRFPDLTEAQQLNKLNYVTGQQLLNLSGPRFLNYKMRGLDYVISDACSSSHRVSIWTLDSNQWLTFKTTLEGTINSDGQLNLAGRYWVTKILILSQRSKNSLHSSAEVSCPYLSLKEKLHLNPNHEHLRKNPETQVCKLHGSFKRIFHFMVVYILLGAELGAGSVADAQDPFFQRNSKPVACLHFAPKRLWGKHSRFAWHVSDVDDGDVSVVATTTWPNWLTYRTVMVLHLRHEWFCLNGLKLHERTECASLGDQILGQVTTGAAHLFWVSPTARLTEKTLMGMGWIPGWEPGALGPGLTSLMTTPGVLWKSVNYSLSPFLTGQNNL